MFSILSISCRRLFGISGPSMCEILNLSNLHFRGRLSLHNMFGIFLRIYWCRNFCDMAEISTISICFSESHMVVNYTPGLNNSKKSDFIPNIRDFSTFFNFAVEISAISQKFLCQYIRKKISNKLSYHHLSVFTLEQQFPRN